MANVYDVSNQYETVLQTRSTAGCTGILVMLGGNNPWAEVAEAVCLSSANLIFGMIDLLLTIFVEVPLVHCVCKASIGYSLPTYAIQHCMSQTPSSLQPVIYGMAHSATTGSNQNLLCPAMIAYAKKQLRGSMQPWFSSVYDGLDALGNSVDYAMVGFDDAAGQCLAFDRDPQVVVIMPEPVDYFQTCATTDFCLTKCAVEWGSFQSKLALVQTPQSNSVTVTQSTQSLFFPTIGVDMVAVGTVYAMTTLTSGTDSICKSSSDACIAAAMLSQDQFLVRYYCVPSSPSQSVYVTHVPGKNWESPFGSSAIQVEFMSTDGSSLAILIQTDEGTSLVVTSRESQTSYLMNVSTSDPTTVLLFALNDMAALQIVNFMVVQEVILATVSARMVVSGTFSKTVQSVRLNSTDGSMAFLQDIPAGLWQGCEVVEYTPSIPGNPVLLMWPTQQGTQPRRVVLDWRGGDFRVQTNEEFTFDTSFLTKVSMVDQSLILSKTLTQTDGVLVMYSHSGNAYDWLSQLRVYANGQTISNTDMRNSQPVDATVTIMTGCDGMDCRGCSDLALRAECTTFQSCSVFNCVGTPVNIKRPLCGIGLLLRSSGLLTVQSFEGAWSVFVDLLVVILQLASDSNIAGVDISAPDTQFMGRICAAKDVSAEFFSVLVATVNSVLQKSQEVASNVQHGALLDSNVATTSSMSSVALVGFFHQVALLPLYVMVVAKKTLMCRLEGLFAIINVNSYNVVLQSAASASASDAMAGMCLTQNAQTMSTQTGDPSVSSSVSSIAAETLTNVAQEAVMMQLEPVMHGIDGFLCYFQGIAIKFAQVLQAYDVRHCVVPDVTLTRAAQCACGDTPLKISAERAGEQNTEYAFWCSGTLGMVDANNVYRVVWNPYSFTQLRNMLATTFDAYLSCVTAGSQCTQPTDPAGVFSVQNVGLIQVFTRCRQNFVNKAWDPAAHVQFNAELLQAVIPDTLGVTASPSTDRVGSCLLDAYTQGVGNGACLDLYMRDMGLSDVYWKYEELSTAQGLVASQVDGCVVFSGGAANQGVVMSRRAPFQNCLNTYATGNSCDLSGAVWSPASGNSLPVASMHVLSTSEAANSPATDPQQSVMDIVQKRYVMAREMVLAAAFPLRNFENTDIRNVFFSAEGDVVHQLLDCVFMGPFAKMDYWPVPVCLAGDPTCLTGPTWFRDESSGTSRDIDIDTCLTQDQLPFTCGSSTRKAMIKYFVQHYLMQANTGGDVVVNLIRSWIESILVAWDDTSKYGCDCVNGGNSVSCCSSTDVWQLPQTLNQSDPYLNSSVVLASIEKQIELFYREAMQHSTPWTALLDAEEVSRYDWTNSSVEYHVVSEARFKTATPLMEYNSSEAMSPPKDDSQSVLWHNCHGALKQVMFTMPVLPGGGLRDTPPVFQGGNTTDFEEYVATLVKSAYESSPLFWHYNPRHHPSNSTMCEETEHINDVKGTLTLDTYSVSGIDMISGEGLPAIHVLGRDFGKIGAWKKSCFCGWQRQGARCIIPMSPAGCSQVPGAVNCSYAHAQQDRDVLTAAFQPTWPCPELELSEQAGILDRNTHEAWLQGGVHLAMSIESILRWGSGGMKIGNTPGVSTFDDSHDLSATMKKWMSPANRQVDPEAAVLGSCGAHNKLPADLLDSFTNDLFPMAQGVDTSAATAHCLRFGIEAAKLQVMMLMGTQDSAAVTAQSSVVQKWRRKCGAQAQLVSLCKALDMYHPNPFVQTPCAMPWRLPAAVPGVESYITPQCLLGVSQVYYDPCVCQPELCTMDASGMHDFVVLNLTALTAPQCAMPLDPRKWVVTAEMGWWPVPSAGTLDPLEQLGGQLNTWLSDPFNLVNMSDILYKSMLHRDRVVNTPTGGDWTTAEGFMGHTSQYCDNIVDYWPDEALFPVGYHVTVPCSSDDTAYRTFDNVFAQDPLDGYMVFTEDQTRDSEYVDSHLWAGGLCRSSSFGFDMYESNNIRVCTRVSTADNVDIHVPTQNDDGPRETHEQCSAKSSELPWGGSSNYNRYDPAFFSVGTLPNMPQNGNTRYPQSSAYWVLGPVSDMQNNGWGEQCGDFDLPVCGENGATCADGFYCLHGVCMSEVVECTMHSDCTDPASMCSGMGTCELAMVSILNLASEDVSVKAHTADCPGESFSMVGASTWGYVPDLLEAHGMCSYRHWREYKLTSNACLKPSSEQDTMWLDASVCNISRLNADPVVDNLNAKWWDPGSSVPTRLPVLPVTCDRDYERFQYGSREFKSCVPTAGQYSLLQQDGGLSSINLQRDVLIRPYQNQDHTVAIRSMPFSSSTTWGFLGGSTDPKIVPCGQIQQCFADTFTKNGVASMVYRGGVLQQNRTILGGQAYNTQDIFRCGVIGYYNTAINKCQIDEKIFPLLSIFCGSQGIPSQCTAAVDATQTTQLCAATIQRTYNPDYSTIHDINVEALRSLFFVFKSVSTLSEHLASVACAEYIYATISSPPYESKGLYFPMAFTLLEFPFPWLYQCMQGWGVQPVMTTTQMLYQCVAYQRWRSGVSSISNYQPISVTGDPFNVYVSTVRGAYHYNTVQSYISTSLSVSLAAWNSAVDATIRHFFGSTDTSYSTCRTERRWVSTADTSVTGYWLRDLIQTYVLPVCGTTARSVALQRYNALAGTQLTTPQLIKQLLTYESGTSAQSLTAQTLMKQIRKWGVDRLTATGTVDQLTLSPVTPSTTPQYPVQYDNSLPDTASDWFQAHISGVDQTLLPYNVDQVSQTILTTGNCPTGNSTWVTLYAGSQMSVQDPYLMTGGTSPLKICPVYQTGLFSCGYPALQYNDTTYTVNSDSPSPYKDITTYITVLYEYALNQYNANTTKQSITSMPVDTVPFFEEEGVLGFGGSGFQFNFTLANAYMANVNPNVNLPVMCTVGNQFIDYSTCTDPNYKALKDHVVRHYQTNGGVILKSMWQVDWEVSSNMMVRGGIYSYSSTNRTLKNQYVSSIMDPQTSCMAPGLASSNKVCSRTVQGSLANSSVMSPWLAGFWNPYEGCDVLESGPEDGYTETIDVQCSLFTSPCASTGLVDNSAQYYVDMPNTGQTCSGMNLQKTKKLNVNKDSPYNLCHQKLQQDSVCQHNQGMVGGTDGFPTMDYISRGDMYTLQNFSYFPNGTLMGIMGNVLFAGGAADYGFLQIPVSHIGGHRIGLVLVPNDDPTVTQSTYVVSRIPLKDPGRSTKLNLWESQDVKQWVPTLTESIAADDFAYRRSASMGNPSTGWDCPLRRRAFYTASVPGFVPYLPSARRSHTLFQNMTGGYYAHPMQGRHDASASFGPYVTTNGFCFCPISEEVAPGQCSIPLTVTAGHNCSLWNTLNALQGKSWQWSHAFIPRTSDNTYKQCMVQLDWPFVGGNLRDNSSLLNSDTADAMWAEASDVEARRCHVLDRMQEFQYTYKSVDSLASSGYTSLDKGVCHTGRAQTYVDAGGARCVRTAKNTDQATLTCDSMDPFTVDRGSSRTPQSAYTRSRVRRQRCSQCSAPPRFKTPTGAAIPPESSFGLQYLLSAERVIVANLQEAVCGNNTECRQQLNTTAWQTGEFMHNFLFNQSALFSAGVLPNTSNVDPGTDPAAPLDDTLLWERPWVYCPTKTSLQTSSNCTGSISKQAWRANKAAVCHSVVSNQLKGQADPMAKTAIANIDSRLDALSKTLQEARNLVASANCLASGNPMCAVQEFVYSPGTWETTNRQFVRQTVDSFYRRMDSCNSATDTGCICPVEADVQAMNNMNDGTLINCPATPVAVFAAVISATRDLVTVLAQTMAKVIDMLFQLALIMTGPSGAEGAKAQAVTDWYEIKRLTSNVKDVVSNVLTDLILFSGTMGPWVLQMLLSMCELFNTANAYFHDIWCSLIVEIIPVFLGTLRAMATWVDVGFTTLNDFMSVILKDVLPEAYLSMAARGYSAAFQSDMFQNKVNSYDKTRPINVFTDPQGKPLSSKERANAAKQVKRPILQKMSQSAGAAGTSIMSSLSGGAGMAANILSSSGSTLAKGAAVGEVLVEGYNLYQTISTGIKIADAMKNFPDEWTIFDFSSLYDAIDAFANFIIADMTCYTGSDAPVLNCAAISLPHIDAAGASVLAPLPTQCWADAQGQQLGVTNLYACSAASMCLPDANAATSEAVLCVQCPIQTNPLFSTYGCNTMEHRCECGVQTMNLNMCLTQDDCSGSQTVCSSVSNVGDVSYGTNFCSECASGPVCVISSNTRAGQCTCVRSVESQVDHCKGAVGSQSYPAPNNLCGYSNTRGLYQMWSDISLIQCSSVARAVCTSILLPSGESIVISLAQTLFSQSAPQSGSRRLLGMPHTPLVNPVPMKFPSPFSFEAPEDAMSQAEVHASLMDPGWNTTATPCSSVAFTYQQGVTLTPSDESIAHSCVYWRHVGDILIQQYNVSSLRDHSTFLLSPDDFASALGNKGVIQALVGNPHIMLAAALYSKWMKPVRAVVRSVYQYNLTQILFNRASKKERRGQHKERTGRSRNGTEDTSMGNTTKPAEYPTTVPETSQPTTQETTSSHTLDNYLENTTVIYNNHTGRRLMSILDDTLSRIKQSDFWAAQNASIPNMTKGAADQADWLISPTGWPAMWSDTVCPVGTVILNAGTQITSVLHTYYTQYNSINAPKVMSCTIVDIVPDLHVNVNVSGILQTTGTSYSSVVTYALLNLFGLTPNDLIAFLSDPCPSAGCALANRWTLQYIINTFTVCDFEATMYCNLHTRPLLQTAVFYGLMYLLVSTLCSLLGIPILSTLFFYAIPVIVVWHSFGISPACAPMVPTCLVDEFIASLNTMLPPRVELPSVLKCANNEPQCLRQCSDLGFSDWSDPLALLAADLGLAPLIQDISYLSPWRDNLIRKRGMIASPDASGYRVCASVTAVLALPWVALAVGLIAGSMALLTYILSIGPALTVMAWHIIVFDHTGG